jgi:serine/threonine protein kinase
MAEVGTVLAGKYEILKEIGKGGMSVVYLAMDTHLKNKQWAVKEVKKNTEGNMAEIVVNSLMAEANLMKRLDHPNLPRIVDIIENNTTIYIVMDFVDGESLKEVLKDKGPQPEEYVIDWAKQLCDALSYLHSQKPPIIYRDMKPGNVMVKSDGSVKIIDFGIAREYKDQNHADTTVLGTKGYAPPEQYAGHTDPRSDIYALGMTMHHLLTGVDPAKNKEGYAPVRMYNPSLSEGIEKIIDKCVQPAPENRYQNCRDLLYDLEHPELITKDFKRRQKRKLRSFLITFIMAVVLVLSGFICRMQATRINNNEYESLISQSSATALSDKINSYEKAIAIYPARTDGYMKMLEAYEDEGQFGKNENNEFLALYNANKDKFDTDSADYAELNYKTGMMYFNYYSEGNGDNNFSDRVQKAYSFFATNYENENISSDFTKKKISDCYYQICSFYKKYILNSVTVEEASKDNYEELFSTIRTAMDDVKDENAYDKLTLYNGTFMLLYDQVGSMVQVAVDESEVIGLLDDVYNAAKELTVQKEQSKKLQNEILDNYDKYRQTIETTYSNAEER